MGSRGGREQRTGSCAGCSDTASCLGLSVNKVKFEPPDFSGLHSEGFMVQAGFEQGQQEKFYRKQTSHQGSDLRNSPRGAWRDHVKDRNPSRLSSAPPFEAASCVRAAWSRAQTPAKEAPAEVLEARLPPESWAPKNNGRGHAGGRGEPAAPLTTGSAPIAAAKRPHGAR